MSYAGKVIKSFDIADKSCKIVVDDTVLEITKDPKQRRILTVYSMPGSFFNSVFGNMNNKWIKCGLPWTFYSDWKDYPKPPNFDRQIKKLFGQTTTQAFKQVPVDDYQSKEYKAAVRKYKKFKQKVDVWVKEQPEARTYNDVIQNFTKDDEQKSFCGMKLNKPGTLIEILDNKVLKQLLIGDINNLGGVCDDCMGFSRDAVVVRYKIMV